MEKKSNKVEYGDNIYLSPKGQVESVTATLSFNSAQNSNDFLVLTDKETGKMIRIQYNEGGRCEWCICDPVNGALIPVDFDISRPTDDQSTFFQTLKTNYPFVGINMRRVAMGLAAERQSEKEQITPQRFLLNGLNRAGMALSVATSGSRLILDKKVLDIINAFKRKYPPIR